MLEVFQCSVNVSWHGQIDHSLLITPVQHHATVPGGCPIFGDLIMLAEGRHEVIGIGFVCVPDGKIVHDQSEMDGTGVMHP